MRHLYKCLKSLVLIKEMTDGWFYKKERCAMFWAGFCALDLLPSTSGSDGTDPPKIWQSLACL